MRNFTLPTAVCAFVIAALVAPFGCASSRTSSGPPHLSTAGPHGPNCAAIQAAGAINFSGDRAAALRQIAQRPDLGAHEQVFLADTVFDRAGFSSDQADVLTALARNPNCTQTARERIAAGLEGAGLMSDDTKRVAEALRAPTMTAVPPTN